MNARTTRHCLNHGFQDYKDYQDKKFVTSDQTKELMPLNHSNVRRLLFCKSWFRQNPTPYTIDIYCSQHQNLPTHPEQFVINDQGELLSAMVTPGNTDDRQPVPQLCLRLFGKLFTDKGYINKNLREILQEEGVSLIYKVRPNRKPEPLSDADAARLMKRMLVESINKELKSQTEV